MYDDFCAVAGKLFMLLSTGYAFSCTRQNIQKIMLTFLQSFSLRNKNVLDKTILCRNRKTQSDSDCKVASLFEISLQT
jgi:hypothetical protein